MNRLSVGVRCPGCEECRTPPENVVECVRVSDWPSDLRPDELIAKCNSGPARDLVLQSEQVAQFAVETLGPKMRVGFGVDQLSVDTDLVT